MLFQIEPDDISRLDSLELVQLMKLLLLSEARSADVPLRAASVAMQITVADGGEDGRVEWTDGAKSTDYFPSRFCIFQSKAQNVTEASIRDEIVKTKKTKAKSSKVLSQALTEAVAKRGSYVVFSSKPFTPPKKKKLIEAVQKAIRDVGKNPARLAAIEIYDGNKIADWVNTHPSVALWVASHDRKRSLSGFQTYDKWGRAVEIRTGSWVAGTSPRFIGIKLPPTEGKGGEPKDRPWTFEQAAGEILTRLSNDHQSIRISGPSGFGKSRFIFEVFNRQSGISDDIDRASIFYADLTIVGDEVLKLALEIADSGSTSILVVDECADEMHLKLAAICQRQDSKLRLVSLDVETQVLQALDTLAIRLEPAPSDMVSEIAKGVSSKLEDADLRLIQEFAHGFPQMAVLAAQLEADGRRTIQSTDQLLARIIWGKKQPDRDAQKALEVLALFEWLGLSGRSKEQVLYVAAELAEMSRDMFVERINSFKARGIVVKRGDLVQVQPLPIAVRLATHRLEVMPDGKLFDFFRRAPEVLQESVLRRIRWLDQAPHAVSFARSLLEPNAFGNLEALNTDFGAKVLDRLVHVDPDTAMFTLNRVFGDVSIEQLGAMEDGRRYLVWALEKLAFRGGSFRQAARILRRFGAAENETRISNNASGQFKQLYQLYLSGTEAAPSERLQILDEGLSSQNVNESALAFEALVQMLDSGHFTRSGGSGEIGSRSNLKDWKPATYGEAWDFHRAAISRLMGMALDDTGPFSARAKAELGRHIRGLINCMPFDDVSSFIEQLVAKVGFWPEAVQELNEWLYFDAKKVPPSVVTKVRELFDKLMPRDPVDLAVLYTHGWQTDFHDPDVAYSADDSDFEYSVRMSVQQAEIISADRSLLIRALSAFVISDAKTPFAFARRLTKLSRNSVQLFSQAVSLVESFDRPPNLQFFGGLIAGADASDPAKARECIRIALQSPKLKPNAISMIGAGKLQAPDLKLVTSLLKSGVIKPIECAPLAYGRGLDHLASKEFMPLMDELVRQGTAGLWTVLDMLSMYLHGGRTPDQLIIRKLKEVLLAPDLLRAINRRHADGHHLAETVARLAKYGAINRPFAIALAKQLLSISRSQEHDIFYELDDHVRKSLRFLLASNPSEVWAQLSQLLLSKDWIVRDRAERLVESERDDNLGPGLLFGVPEALYLDWVRLDPAVRASIVVKWLPVATRGEDDKLSWHPALDSFIREFGALDKVLASVSVRLHPRSWWGSIAPLLEPLISLLRSWENHPIPQVRYWAEQKIEYLKQDVTDAKRGSEEESAAFD